MKYVVIRLTKNDIELWLACRVDVEEECGTVHATFFSEAAARSWCLQAKNKEAGR